ncbi:MAG: metallophosphoesterase [Candidatus Hydrogenedentota bacterium]
MKSWSFVFVTDIQVGSPKSFRYAPAWVENWRTAREQIVELNPDLVLIGGDLTRDAWLDGHFFELEAIKADLDGLPMPYYVTPGNMDVGNKHADRQGAFENRDDIANNMSSERLQRFCGLFGPHCWSFVHKNVRFSAFTSMLPGSGLPEEAEFWTWMEAQRNAPRAKHHVWMSHYPLFIESPDEPNWDLTKRGEYHAWYFGLDEPHRSRILEILRETGTELFLSGHVHCRKRHVAEGIVFDLGPATCFAQWADRWKDGDPALGFMRYDVAEDGIDESFVPLRAVSDAQGYGPGGHPKPEDRDYSIAWEK